MRFPYMYATHLGSSGNTTAFSKLQALLALTKKATKDLTRACGQAIKGSGA
jgi:hypothetical protein